MYRMKLLDYRPFATLLAVWLITTGVLGYLTIYKGYTHLYAENGLMENLQVFLLCAAFPGFVHTAITTRYPNKTLPWFMALLVFSFVFRELDVDKFDVPELIIFLFAGDGRALYLAPLLVILVKLIFNSRHFIRHAHCYADKASVKFIILAGFCYVLFSETFDKGYIAVSHSNFWEESFEIAATMLLCAASFRTLTADLNRISEQIENEQCGSNNDNAPT